MDRMYDLVMTYPGYDTLRYYGLNRYKSDRVYRIEEEHYCELNVYATSKRYRHALRDARVILVVNEVKRDTFYTDEKGQFRTDVPLGSAYKVIVEKEGYKGTVEDVYGLEEAKDKAKVPGKIE